MAHDLTQQFLDGLGPEFKKAIKSYINELYTDQLAQIKEHKQQMAAELDREVEVNHKVTKINSFYKKVVDMVSHFEWCQVCKKNGNFTAAT